MNLLFKHTGAAIGGAIIPPTIYFLTTTIPVFSFSTPAPTPTQMVTPTPSETPTPYPTNTPTPKPTAPTSTPTNTPTPTLPPVTSNELDGWFKKYSNEYSIDRTKLWSVAVCESNLNPNAKNGDYGGLYQFASGTWRSARASMNADTNTDLRFDPEEAIRTAAFKISVSGYTSWPNCSK